LVKKGIYVLLFTIGIVPLVLKKKGLFNIFRSTGSPGNFLRLKAPHLPVQQRQMVAPRLAGCRHERAPDIALAGTFGSVCD
jgi:hypothetical protein